MVKDHLSCGYKFLEDRMSRGGMLAVLKFAYDMYTDVVGEILLHIILGPVLSLLAYVPHIFVLGMWMSSHCFLWVIDRWVSVWVSWLFFFFPKEIHPPK